MENKDLSTLDVIPPLEGWVTIPTAATMLGVGRARVHQMVKRGEFKVKDLRLAGPTTLIKRTAVEALVITRHEAVARKCKHEWVLHSEGISKPFDLYQCDACNAIRAYREIDQVS